MDFCRNVSVSSEYHPQEQVLQSPSLCSKFGAAITPASPLDDLFSAQNTEVDFSLEWLSVFVEDCLSSTGNCLPAPAVSGSVQNTNSAHKLTNTLQQKPQETPSSLEKFAIPGKARSKRKRATSVKTRNNPLFSWSYSHHQALHFPSSDPPLLHQAYWLADSELIVPKKEGTAITTTNNSNKDKARYKEEVHNEETTKDQEEEVDVDVDEDQEKVSIVLSSSNNSSKKSFGILESSSSGQQQQPRRCTHCLSQRTPQWRAGPLGPKTLCNACGVRYKSGRLLPEYRPAKSPTFVSYLHSNSHKKVLEMRMASSSSSSAAATTVFNS
ncbi:GATA transcription factor 9-like [Ricinus communis]|uniref:GATA transcription factor 9-like n=1 Tax=Ricinus communis TaxID=3988 RepID=UPI00201A5833|nr:GATA transcription factor 9-like [Ricinus communis]